MHYFRYLYSYFLKSKSAGTLRTFPIKRFWAVLKAKLFKLGLKKARKASQFSKRSSKEWLYLQRAPFGVFFLYFLTKLVQMWLQRDKVSCLKTLINTILSTFRNTSWFIPWGVFRLVYCRWRMKTITFDCGIEIS